MQRLLFIALTGVSLACQRGFAEVQVLDRLVYTGMCDASAAVALNSELFAVADDEDSRIRIYRRDKGGPPLQVIDFSKFLATHGKSSETDLEGAAQIGDRIYWITSHARNKDGEMRPNRYRFFATVFSTKPGRVDVEFIGKADKNLLSDLVADPKMARFNLASASRLPPKARNGLNIEGMCATKDGYLLIGFRNPIPNKRALLVPLLNPTAVVDGESARFGEPILLDLAERGVRDIAFCDGRYFIVAGASDGSRKSRLYSWDGGDSQPVRLSGSEFKDLNPEAIVIYPDKRGSEFQILSDDGTREIKGTDCKDLKDDSARRFRGIWIRP